MAIYRVVGGVNREIKSITRAVNGVNKTIKEVYRSVGNVNRKVYESAPSGALYWYGNKCIDKTGGWKFVCRDVIDSTNIIEHSDHIEIQEHASQRGMITVNSINLTGYTKVCCLADLTYRAGSQYHMKLTVVVNSMVDKDIVYTNSSTAGLQTLSVSIANINASYRICMFGEECTSLNIYAIWLE